MKLSKHIHSCLLIEDHDTTILIDPGMYTYREQALDINAIKKLDYLLITHEHQDHLFLPLIKDLLAKFPKVSIITNQSAAQMLGKENIAVQTNGNPIISMENAPHEKLWDKEVPQNVVIQIFEKLTHPGDSLQFPETTDVLALPIQGPWCNTTQAVEKAASIKPKVIIPIHDWMWKDEVRKEMYIRLANYFKTVDIDFKPLETGEVIEV
jgi:L-ascorbate metabolism protein UlaG (beta-lactamase superfamily)